MRLKTSGAAFRPPRVPQRGWPLPEGIGNFGVTRLRLDAGSWLWHDPRQQLGTLRSLSALIAGGRRQTRVTVQR